MFYLRLPDTGQLGGLTKLIGGADLIRKRNCYALNFGWSEELSVPQLVVNLDNDDQIFKAEMVRQSAHSNCFMVFIGGRYANRLDEIFQKMESVIIGLVTKQLIYFAEQVKWNPKVEALQSILVNIKRHL